MQGDTQAEYYPDLRWNVRMFVLNGAAFRVVGTLFNPNLVVVVFLAYLTDNPFILGLPAALWMGGLSFTQLWASGRVQRLRTSLPVYRATSLLRAVMWLVVLVAVAFVDNPDVLITVFLLFLLVYPLVWGAAALVFFDLLGKLIPPRARGPVLSWRMSLGGVLALGASWFVNRVLDDGFVFGFPHNFLLIFAATAIVTIIGVLPFHSVREPEEEPRQTESAGLRGQWSDIRRIWRSDALYRRFIVARAARLLAAGTAPLIIVYAGARFHVPLGAAAIFLAADTITNLVVVTASGWLSVRMGNRWLAVLSSVLGVAVFLMIALAGPLGLAEQTAMPYFLVVFVLFAAYNGSTNVSLGALNINLAPPEERPLYVGLGAAIAGLAFYASAGQGAVVALIGYPGLFLLALLLMAVSLWQILRLHDPTEVREVRVGARP